MRKPLSISCIVPCYNAASTIRETLQAICASAKENDEIIAVYDESNDETLSLLREFQSTVRVIELRRRNNPSAASAINRGFVEARGDIFCWLGADDYVFPWSFDVVRKAFEALPEVNWLTSMYPSVISSFFPFPVKVGMVRGMSKQYFLDGFTVPGKRRGAGWIQQESTFWRRDLWERAGGHLDESFRIKFDLELWSRFFDHAELFLVDSLLGAFRYREGQLSADTTSALQEANTILNNARKRNNWSSNKLREILIFLGRKEWSVIRSTALTLAPYDKSCIINHTDIGCKIKIENFWIF